MSSERRDEVAIVGLGCMFPGAPDVETFWRNILAGVDAVTDPPPEAWDPAVFYDVASEENDRVYCRKGGFLGSIAYFDPVEHGIMPRAVEGGEPDQWLALHVARQAFRDAGYGEGPGERVKTAVILGKGTYVNRGNLTVVQHGLVVDYTLQLLRSLHPELTDDDLQAVRADLKRQLPRFDAETAAALIPNVSAGRIANRLDLMGPSYTVDAACASSLIALEIALNGLRSGEFDLALIGGMQVATPIPVLSLFCRLKALSPSERIRPFDASADGTILGEGLGMAVLKRRADAERDGNRIYAVVRGAGAASDGKALSVLAPRLEGEELALRRAYEDAGVAPRTVGLVEAHGTATLVGDATEVEALSRVFGERGERPPRCALGSVKSMIGHTMPAAGMAGLIKTSLALYHRVLPPTLNVEQPNPRLHLERTPFYLNTETRPWVHGGDEPRRAGINSFGFGGINAHVILEEADADPAAAPAGSLDRDWDSEVFLFTGRTREEVVARATRVRQRLDRPDPPALRDLAWTLNAAGGPAVSGEEQRCLAIVAGSVEELGRRLDRALKRLADPACARIKEIGGTYYAEQPLARSGRLGFIFPGEGAQYVNMLADLCRHFPVVRACFDEMDRVFAHHARGYVPSDFVFPPPAFSDEDRAAAERRLWQMDVAIEALVTANHALAGLLAELGIRPDALLGHSTGEYSAMRAAGMIDERDYATRLIELNRLYEGAAATGLVPVQTSLVAIGGSRERVAALAAPFGEDVFVAMDNCRHQVVLAARSEVADALVDRVRGEGLIHEVLRFDRPYHTPLFEGYAEIVREFLSGWIARVPAVTLYSCTSVAPYPDDLDEVRHLAFEHWLRPVEFRRTVEAMHDDGVRLFVEVGPRGNLTAFVEDILAGRDFIAVAANVSRRSGVTQLNHLLGCLAAHGVPMRLDPLYARRGPARVDLDAPAGPPARPRPSARRKLLTGVPDMALSAEAIARLRARLGTPAAPAAAAPAPVAPVAQGPQPAIPAPAPAPQPPPPAPAPVAAPAATASSSPAPVASASGTPVADGPDRQAVMSAYLETMGRFLGLAQGLAAPAPAPPAPAPDAAPRVARPFTADVVEHLPGRAFVARCLVSRERFPFLDDHTLGRNLSVTDPALRPLAVMPFTMTMEMLAEAGAALAPGQVLASMEEVRAYRFIALADEAVTLEIRAERDATTGAVRATVVEAPPGGRAPATAPSIAEATLRFAASWADAPAAPSFDVRDARPYRLAPHRLYDEAMFHGPRFRGVAAMGRVGPDAAEADLIVPPRGALFAGGGVEHLVTDPILLDQPGQVVGFWASQLLERGLMVLPFRLERLTLFGPLQPEGARLGTTAAIALHGDSQVRSDLDVVDAGGRLLARFEGWWDRRFDLPDGAFQLLLAPRDVLLAKPWTAPGAESVGAAWRVGLDAFPPGWFSAHGGIWQRVLACLVLSRREREIWRELKYPEGRRLEWLLGRIAAKDGVREHVRAQTGYRLAAADVEILPDADGRPIVGGAWTGAVARVPSVSVSHAAGTAVALVSAEGRTGVDLERVDRVTADVRGLAFTPAEEALIAALGGADGDESWAARVWCAKEAASKALGDGLAAGPSAFEVRHVDRARGTMEVSPGRRDGGAPVTAFTVREGAFVVATAVVHAEEGSSRR